MKTSLGAVGAAVAASACCVTPVLFTLLGAGALGASAIKLEPYRPWFLGLTVVLLGAAFYGAYRPMDSGSCVGGTCTPHSYQTTRILAWIAAVVAALLIAFPYYVSYFI